MSHLRLSLGLLCVLSALQAAPADEAPPAASSVYVANDRAGTVSAFHIDAATGALTPLAAAAITRRPVATEPVKVTERTSGWRTSASPASSP